ncbi:MULTISPECIES: transporter substrate-binding domain-containing protein [unclassified Halomonas]|uniref:transporter substrate-binding domain-containing protein n=1 Tax=unclassified Halomonas TaxID=2609666 RepID=UPI001E40CB0A|nr:MULTISPECIES: transporter substrate-binding domain-containing protein [unclassified Halomonas]MDT0501631.1 transporter substrate-binding domain-containing protein [Halomonas sp. PAR7]MDT0512107.1 transporter substrate-binding domain-containing protein [Halomonas sp. LES1]MDT0590756.1 transporter substrate-binding domain-containing protein [Halomonas sp. PAR8]
MKVSMMIATAATAFGLAQATQAADPLKIGISGEPYPPFSFKAASGDWSGFEVELAREICDAMDRQCEITPTGWSGIIPSLKAGRIDMIMNSMSITEKRQRVIDFTRPYYFTPGAYVAASDLSLTPPDDLDGLVMGVQSATTNATYARRALRDNGVDIRLYDQAEQVNNDLLSGRLDVILADQIAMAQFLARDEAEEFEMKATAPHHAAYGEGVGIGLRQEDDELEVALNQAIAAVIEDGTCASLSEQYLGTDVCVYD